MLSNTPKDAGTVRFSLAPRLERTEFRDVGAFVVIRFRHGDLFLKGTAEFAVGGGEFNNIVAPDEGVAVRIGSSGAHDG